MNYKMNLEYFSLNIYKVIGISLISVALLILAPLTHIIVAFVVILFGIAFYIGGLKSDVTDAEYDHSVLCMIEDIKQKALDKFGIDEDEVSEIEPIIIGGYDYKDYTLSKRGKDRIWRTNQYKCIMILFSANEVYCYTYKFKTTVGEKTEDTDVYFYKDIVSVSTSSETIKLKNSMGQEYGKQFSCEYFKLTTSGGTSLTVSCTDKEKTQTSINSMRKLLKLKKQ